MKALLIILGITLLTPAHESRPLVHRLIVQSTSTLDITGTTNLNRYVCAITKYTGNDTLVLHEGGKDIRPVFVKGEVGLDASTFDCGVALMTADFQKAINAREYPAIVIDFISFERMPAYTGREQFKGIIKISIAGVARVFEVTCGIDVSPSGIISLTGGREFQFSDFNLTPPTRMMGMVRVDRALRVSFHLRLLLDPNS